MKRQIIKTRPMRPYRIARIAIALIVLALIVAAVVLALHARAHAAVLFTPGSARQDLAFFALKTQVPIASS